MNDDRAVDRLGFDLAVQDIGRAGNDEKFDARILHGDPLQRLRHKACQRGRHRAELQLAADLAGMGDLLQLLDLIQDLAGERDDGVAGRRQRHHASGAHDEFGAEFFFERHQPFADRGGGDTELAGGARERSEFGDRRQRGEQTKIHACDPSDSALS